MPSELGPAAAGSRPLPWRSNALELLVSLEKVATGRPQIVSLGHGLLWATELAGPNPPLVIHALRQPDVWGNRDKRAGPAPAEPGVPEFHEVVSTLAQAAEEVARGEAALSVGERHVVTVLKRHQLHRWGIHAQNLTAAVVELELGPHFDAAVLEGSWHGFVDTNIVLQFNDLHQIDWQQELGQKQVTLWLAGSLLNELDELQHSSGSRRVRNRAERFARWLHPVLEAALSPAGAELRAGVRVRVWAPAGAGLRDTDHLEAALELLERGVPLTVITRDLGMSARARSQGLPVYPMTDRYKLPAEPTPAEERERLLLEAEGYKAPAKLALRVDRSPAGMLLLYVDCAPDGGESQNTTVRWYAVGREWNPVDPVSGKELRRDQDGWIRQQISAHLAPGTSELLAYVGALPVPGSFVYELRAAGSEVSRGEMWWTGQSYERREPMPAPDPDPARG